MNSLTREQAALMEQRLIKKHDVAIILLHWFNATVWLFELLTGVALITSPHFRLAPDWYLALVQDVFGTRASLLRFHIALGLTWIGVFLVYGIFGFRTYLVQTVVRREVHLDRDDLEWLRIRVLRILGRSREPLPPQGSYNAGQKLFALSVYLMVPLVMLSGLVMTFHWFGAQVVAWAIVVHFVTVGLVVSGLMIHVYMGAVFPEEKPAFFSMLTGMVNEKFAYQHHHKWWQEMQMAQPATEAPPGASWFERAFRSPAYWPPYVAGAGLGLTLLVTFLVVGNGLGASGGFTRYLAAAIGLVAPGYAAAHPYWSAYFEGGSSPLQDFLVFEVIGVALGGFVSGWLARRVKLDADKGPRITRRRRYALALTGGILTGIGARLARGCTSGLALSGGAVLSAGAFVFMLSVFAAGFIGAYFLRRYWL